MMRGILLVAIVLLFAGCSSSPFKSDSNDGMGDLANPDNQERESDVYARLALEYMKIGQPDIALTNLQKGLNADPDNINLQNVTALVYEKLGKPDAARRHYQKALSIDSNNPYVLNAYGTFLCKQGEYNKAIDNFTKALSNPLYPTKEVALTNAGVCAAKIPEYDKAENFFRQALRVNPRFPIALSQMAIIMQQKENYLSARAYIQRYEAVAKPNAELLWTAIQVERALGDKDKASSYALLLRNKFPDSEQAARLDEGV